MAHTTFECRKHGLKYEQPEGEIVDCPKCTKNKLDRAHIQIEKITEQRDKLLEAIDIKLNAEVQSL